MKTFTEEEVLTAKREVYAMFGVEVVAVAQVGSTYISGAGEDLDLVVRLRTPHMTEPVLLTALCEGREYILASRGYRATGQDSGSEDDFETYRKGDVNLMLTYSSDFFSEFVQAAEVCKYISGVLFKTHGHGLDKVHRIKIHRIIMNGEDA